jgi:hypothetical protein
VAALPASSAVRNGNCGALTCSNSYSGGTTVTGDLINFNSAGNFGSGSITA